MRQKLPQEFFDIINKQKLSYKNSKGTYQCSYQVYPFRDKGIISVHCTGKATFEDADEEFNILDNISKLANKWKIGKSFIIKYDSRETTLPSTKVRKLYLEKVSELLENDLIEHTAYIENRQNILAFSKVFLRLFKCNNYSIHSNAIDADKKIANLCYNKLSNTFTNYKQNPSNISQIHSVTLPEWSLTEKDFTIHAALLRGNILYAKVKGNLTKESLKATYTIYRKVIEYNGGSTAYSIMDFQKINNISRSTRKVFEQEQENISITWGQAFCILPPYLENIFEIYKRFKPQSIYNLKVVKDFETAFQACQVVQNKKDNIIEYETNNSTKINKLQEEVKALKVENAQIKTHQNKIIEQLTNTLGTISWNDTFSPYKINVREDDPFFDLCESVMVLQKDILEILNIEKQHNEKLNELVATKTNELKSKENHLRNIINFSDKIIWLVDKDFRLLEANHLFFDYTSKAFNTNIAIGDDFFNALENSELKTKLKEWFLKALTGKNAIHQLEYRHKQISVIHEYNIFPVRTNGKVKAISVRVTDISDIKRAEKKLSEQNTALKKVNTELDHFVYSVSHDLRAPLTSIMGLINLMKRETDLEVIKHYINLQEKSTKKLDNFIQDIIHLSRNDRTELKIEEINLEEFFDNIISDLQFAENAQLVEVITDINQAKPFLSDKNRLKIICHNIISNGFRYADLYKQKSYIKIIVNVKDAKTIIKVSDNGQGIKKEHHKKIFDMFYRASKQKNGSGLGLYILNESLKKLKGEISLESEYGIGTSFIVQIPNYIEESVIK